ncbi:PREDICTED: cleavage and polyadenylation specificity factor subunit 2 isoform [Prunus dulcis]|uniref:PREDICTED: cleavage and polyadenylation specificity factor subunit 2 isoform n=1 Tax=Prunus dulcis TaxID=3755 RepID=A0A5E4EW95_PRUDU|nr:uncharacterized protein LOC117628969 [Prunus dulcis]KAI5351925.1 hypothetical protein L3X38_004816 [Prunus dulcis]VVA19994.1 PREDICTED: cleavage and polyadenylation specificity factor subunit 2 isoform [Prunus dulcis]
MDSKDENVELINEAIKRLLEERKNRDASADDDDDCLLLSRLLSQVESLKGNERIQKPEALTKPGELTSSADGYQSKPKSESGGDKAGGDDGGSDEIDREEIIKELNKVKRQNTITHWLLSVMIVLTVAWQASEVTLLWKFKDGLSHPFKYFGDMLTGKGAGKDSEEHKKEVPPLPCLKIPELPHVELPDMSLTGEQH